MLVVSKKKPNPQPKKTPQRKEPTQLCFVGGSSACIHCGWSYSFTLYTLLSGINTDIPQLHCEEMTLVKANASPALRLLVSPLQDTCCFTFWQPIRWFG